MSSSVVSDDALPLIAGSPVALDLRAAPPNARVSFLVYARAADVLLRTVPNGPAITVPAGSGVVKVGPFGAQDDPPALVESGANQVVRVVVVRDELGTFALEAQQTAGASSDLEARLGFIDSWIQIGDTALTEASPLALVTDVAAQLTNNAGNVLDEFAPAGFSVSDFLAGNALQGVARGASFDLRVTAQVKPELADRTVEIHLDIGGSQGVIASASQKHTLSGGVAELITWYFPYYQLNTFIANGGTINIKCNGNADVFEPIYFIKPTSRGEIA